MVESRLALLDRDSHIQALPKLFDLVWPDNFRIDAHLIEPLVVLLGLLDCGELGDVPLLGQLVNAKLLPFVFHSVGMITRRKVVRGRLGLSNVVSRQQDVPLLVSLVHHL